MKKLSRKPGTRARHARRISMPEVMTASRSETVP